MPTYVYKNLKTGKVFELEQRITEAVLTKDPKTGHPVERVIQAAGIVFKGGGFYKTDSRPAEKSGKPASKPEAASSKTGDSGSSDSSSSGSDGSGSSGSGGSGSGGSGSETSGSSTTDSSKSSSAEKPAKAASSTKSVAKD
jgi:predicted nucleic acid-binding Zn ribbon protein